MNGNVCLDDEKKSTETKQIGMARDARLWWEEGLTKFGLEEKSIV
ncbi:MAG TPA: hypothetical protein VJT71_17710 [Pyrinomonadaceae bacterium]|nr:hypothetical protein [Pyrinomonadaceae bacterium]